MAAGLPKWSDGESVRTVRLGGRFFFFRTIPNEELS